MEAKPSYQQLAKINKRLDAENKEMQWLKEKEQIQETEPYAPFYGDVTELNTQRTILDSVGKKNLQELTSELMDLLQTSVAIYEANGDYAYGNFNSDWCRLMDSSSRKLCNTEDNKKALNCDKWFCHYCCWNDSAKPAIISKKPTDINCVGGIKLYAEPVFCGNEVIGTINIGYGNPPKDEATLRKLSKKFSIDLDLLKANSEKYNPRPEFIIRLAKKRLKSTAKLIGEIVARKQSEESLTEINREINIKNDEIAAQNEEIKAQNEELAAQNEEIESQNEEYQQLNEELRHTNEHLHHAKEEIKESEQTLKVLLKGSRLVLESKDFVSSAQQIFDYCRELTGAKAGYVALLNENGEENDVLYLEPGGMPCSVNPDLPMPIRGLREVVYKTGKATYNNNYNVSPHVKYMPEGHMPLKNVMFAPLKIDNETIGLLGLGEKDTDFTDKDAEIATSFAELISIALINSKNLDAIKQSEKRYREFIENFQGIAFEGDMNFTPHFFHGKIESITGYNEKDFAKDKINWFKIIHSDDVPKILASAENIKTIPYFKEEREYRIKRKDGEIRWVREMLTNKCDESNNPVSVYGAIYDITDRKKAEEQLKITLNKLESLFKNSPNLISILDSKGTYIKVSDSLANVIGLKPEKISGKTIYDFLPKEIAENFQSTIDAVLKENSNIRKTDIIPVDGKSRFFESFVFPVKQNADQTEMIGVISVDITELKEVEQGLLKAKQQAEAANLAKSEFLANMSHEIRIPLYGVKGFNELLMSTELNPTQKEYVEKSSISANMLMDLLNDILDLSKIEAGKLELEEVKVDVARLTEDIFDIFQHEAKEKNSNIKLNIDDKLPGFVFVDPTKLRQVLMNLISNAVKFTEEGSIEIKVKFKKKIAAQNKGTFYFSVKDTGIGISKEDQKKLFKVFSQADTSTTRKYGGSGLGLVISYKIIEKMGSKLKLKSIPGKGSEFFFSLDREYEDGKQAKIAEKKPQKKKIKKDPVILVVEDVEMIMFLIKSILKQILPQAHIVEAFNGAEGIEKYKEVNPDFVLLDIQMPVKDGYTAAKEIRQYEKENNLPRKPVIALTARAVKGEREKCLAAGMDDFMTKPIGQNDLIDALDEYLTEPPKSKKLKAGAVDKDKTSPGYEHFNKQELIDKFGGDSKECEELLKMALEKIPGYIAGLKKEIEGNDFKTIKKAAHKLKGAALFVSFNQLGTLAKKLEHNEKHDIGVVKGLLEEIEREFEEVKKVVERHGA